MAVFMFTQRLWRRLGAPKRLEALSEPSENRLGAFCLTLVKTDLGELVLCMSQTTRLCVLVPVRPIEVLLPSLLVAWVDELSLQGIPEALIQNELFALEGARFGTNADKSLLGAATWLGTHLDHYAKKGRENGEGISFVQARLNVTPHVNESPPYPDVAVKKVFGMLH